LAVERLGQSVPHGVGIAHAVGLMDGVAHVAGSSGLALYDVTGPEIVPLGYVPWFGEAYDLQVADGLAYVAEGYAGLAIVDVSDPSQPERVASLALDSPALRVRLAGEHVLVSTAGAGLAIVRVSDPSHPVLASTLASPSQPTGVAADGSLAVVTAGEGGVYFVDLSDPAVPVELAHLPVSYAADAAIHGHAVYIATGYEGLVVVDATDPSHPVVVVTPPGIQGNPSRCPVVRGDRLAFAVHGVLTLASLADPLSPVVLGHLVPPIGTWVEGLDLEGDRAVLGGAGMWSVDLTDPAAPKLAASFTDPLVEYHAVSVDGDYAYVAGDNELAVLDVSDPGTPVRRGRVAFPKTFGGARVHAAGGVVWAMARDGTCGWCAQEIVHAVDVADPDAPAILSEVGLPGGMVGVHATSDGLVYAVTSQGLAVLDGTDPAAPVKLSEFWDVSISQAAFEPPRVVYFGYSGWGVVDASDPHALQRHEFDLELYYPGDIAVAGDLVLLLNSGQVRVLDAGDPSAPVERAVIDLPGDGGTLALFGSTAYIGGPRGLYVLDLEDPARPRVDGQILGLTGVRELIQSGGHLIAARGPLGLAILETTCQEVTK
jgi:hypothetical protein